MISPLTQKIYTQILTVLILIIVINRNDRLTVTASTGADLECQFLPETNYFGHEPTLLLSFPGSGNTWARLLIRELTGYGTGSVYYDRSLLSHEACEEECSMKLIAIKGHPQDFKLDRSYVRSLPVASMKKCFAQTRFTRVLVIARNPYHSLLSEYHLWATNTHSDEANLTAQSKHAIIFPSKMLSMAEHLNNIWQRLLRNIPDHVGEENVLFIKYEDILDRNVVAIQQLIHFVTNSTTVNLRTEDIMSAFERGENPNIHRNKTINATELYGSIDRLSCRIYAKVASYCEYFDYDPIGECEQWGNVPPLRLN